MKILVACEESQVVTIAFRRKGHEAFSCDIVDCSGGYPQWHIKDDVRNVLFNNDWDMLIAHPPCTYLSRVVASHLNPNGKLNVDRYIKGLEAKEFFMMFYNANIKYICIENPIPMKIFNLPMYSQIVQPYEFGHYYSKSTCLWLINLPGLISNDLINYQNVITTKNSKWYNSGGIDRQKNRSKTFPGIAKAMAEQWNFY